ncbi:BREX-2 system adenine-specific DNA-methyltransferase PglX [Paraburkholderia mimosarum]|uniref:BREX-2 system adenine-specific DNA-methyltransferase PglX n=1 Tax=Paraburkholderia mimosarum TaxID=312026 RepID=UPI00040E52B7|nr:BREX-2 system adenine-specific DNA-methyltransferase PglX [Paraburkholderia mimosarum]
MINRTKLLADLKLQVRDLEADLRQRFATNNSEYQTRLTADWQAARDAGRTSEDVTMWAEAQFTQSAVAWVLACVFVRFCEDNDLLDAPLISGTNSRGQTAVSRQEAFYLQNPTASDNDYLRDVFAVAGRLPGLSDVLKVQCSLLLAPVSADMGKQLVRFFRATNADSGALVHDFADFDWNTRFLGDLYQDLSEAARERYALLQTPEFVESFILDRTLTPALDIYTLEEVDLIDPTCGSGHFLLGAFERLAPRWLRKRPDNVNLALQEALDRIAGVDLNPYAVVIARFRLLIAALKMAGVRKLRLAPNFHLHIETGDSLLHGFDQRDYTRAQVSLALDTPQENLASNADHLYRHAFATEDLTATNQILARKYAAVVGNPPYIAVKDRAVSALYRERFSSCHGKYALVSPFCERFWALAKPLDNAQRAGYVGLIVGNAFMKREFGKKLVEAFFPTVDLTHVIDTAGAYIPGHGTPTVILEGRNRPPASPVIRAAMGIEGEPSTPDDPSQGIVWRAIVDQIDRRDSESKWISVSDIARNTLAKHPWSIGGGGASSLKEAIEDSTERILSDMADSIGITSFTLEDNAYIQDSETCRRHGIEAQLLRDMVVGDEVRDWFNDCKSIALFPYGADFSPVKLDEFRKTFIFLWPYRTCLSNSKMFGGQTKVEAGLNWFEYGRLTAGKLATPLSITFAFVATHNHFILDRGGKIFNRSSPVIKLPVGKGEDEHLGLVGLLNSSAACFWLKQMFHNKGSTVDQHGARQRTSAFEDFYEYTGTGVGKFPVPNVMPIQIARQISDLAIERSRHLPAALTAKDAISRTEFDAARTESARIRLMMIAWQEELDWKAYSLFGVTDGNLCFDQEPPEVKLGERAFEIALAQDCSAGKVVTTWFDRHRSQPITTVPAHWPADYRALVERRIAAIRQSRDLALIERPEYKRRWASDEWDTLEKAALEQWLLARLEGADLWPRDAHPAPKLRVVRELVDALSGDEEFRRALDLYAGSGSDAHATVVALVQQASVPYLDALRYSDSGLRKRSVWRNTWLMQRREDAIDAEVARRLTDEPIEVMREEQATRKAAEVGVVPVPPKYKQADYREGVYWKLRGALDVPKERFVCFPGLERSNDAGSPMLLWAGYDAKARALALTGYLYEMLQREGADAARLTPALAGLDELLPWVHQWHPEVDDDLGMSTGDYLQGLLDAQLAQHGLTLSAVRAWQPQTPVRRTRGRRSSTAAEA